MLTFFPPGLRRQAERDFSRSGRVARRQKGLSGAPSLEFNASSQGRGRDMPRGLKATGTALLIAAAALLFAAPAYAQGKKAPHAPAPPPREPVDEKAYKAALDRIPTPKQGYDPWGQMRPAEPAKTPGKQK
jgi:hypothetical protein